MLDIHTAGILHAYISYVECWLLRFVDARYQAQLKAVNNMNGEFDVSQTLPMHREMHAT